MKVQAEKLEEFFNLPPTSQIIEGEFTSESKDITVATNSNISVTINKLDDSDYIRTNLKELADKTQEALDLALQIQAEDPTNSKNTEAVAKMADAVAKALSNLIHLNKAEKDEQFRSKEIETPKVVNNNLTIMTTEDLISKIIAQTKQLKEK